MSRNALLHEMVKAGIISQADSTAMQDDTSLTLVTQGGQGSAVADATGGATVDAEARTAINDLLAELRTMGVIAT